MRNPVVPFYKYVDQIYGKKPINNTVVIEGQKLLIVDDYNAMIQKANSLYEGQKLVIILSSKQEYEEYIKWIQFVKKDKHSVTLKYVETDILLEEELLEKIEVINVSLGKGSDANNLNNLVNNLIDYDKLGALLLNGAYDFQDDNQKFLSGLIESFGRKASGNHENKNFTCLKMPNCKLSDKQAALLVESLNIKTVKRLDLSGNAISDKTATRISMLISRGWKPLELNLSGISTFPGVQDNLFQKIASANVYSLSLNNTKLDHDKLPFLTGGKKHLKRLALANSGMGDDNRFKALLVLLVGLINLEYLDISGNDFSPKQMKEIASTLNSHNALRIMKITMPKNLSEIEAGQIVKIFANNCAANSTIVNFGDEHYNQLFRENKCMFAPRSYGKL